MCLSIPSKALSTDENNLAIVKTLDIKRRVRLDIIGSPYLWADICLYMWAL